MSQHLPALPHLDHLKHHAKAVLRLARLHSPDWQLADAQSAVALGYGFPSWAQLKRHVDSVRQGTPAGNDTPAVAFSARDVDPLAVSAHSICGTWVSRTDATAIATAAPYGRVILEIDEHDGLLTLTQIASGPDGRAMANTVRLQTDGQAHPLPFGEAMTMEAAWSDAQTLQTIARRGTEIVGRGVYTISMDGQSMNVTTPERMMMFERLANANDAVVLSENAPQHVG